MGLSNRLKERREQLGLTQSEVASLLGITEHTSSSQFYRAKSLLIKKINEYRKRKLE